MPEKSDGEKEPTRCRYLDEYDNVFETTETLSQGGQGIVYRMTDPDLALKRPMRDGKLLEDITLNNEFKNVFLLALPDGIPVTTPRCVLKECPGYIMSLLNGMKPISCFQLTPEVEKEYDAGPLPAWLSAFEKNRRAAYVVMHYARTGGAKRRLLVLAKTAAILARLHAYGLVYGDISQNNVFMGAEEDPMVWLIDADNIRLERLHGGGGVYTPGLGAPEIVKGEDSSRPRSDCWAFSVLAYKLLRLAHPFIGTAVTGESGEEEDWANETGTGLSAEEMAYRGEYPFVDDESDRSNVLPKNATLFAREWLFTPQLRQLFQETLGAGRKDPSRRPAMGFWAMECARAADSMVICPNCGMSYFPDSETICPYCDSTKPTYVEVKTARWKLVLSARDGEKRDFKLPHRLFHPFSLRHFAEEESVLTVDFENRSCVAQRGTVLPDGVTIEFVEETK